MTNRRDFLAASAAMIAGTLHADEPARKSGGSFGIVIHSYSYRAREKGFTHPANFLAFCRERGADGIQISLGQLADEEAKALRAEAEKQHMYVEGSIRPPKDKADLDRFEKDLLTSKLCGANVLRTVLSPGRRYEVFKTSKDYATFAENALVSLRLAEPVLAKHKRALAVENHKDYRTDELVAVMKAVSSEFIGVCIDTGNNLALLENPTETVEALAPWTRSCHLKDMGVEESPEAFELAEVPLGTGFLDLKRIVDVLKKARPAIRFNLEMITRDPLRIPCFSEEYWKTLDKVPLGELVRIIEFVKKNVPKEPLPRTSKLSPKDQLAVEDANVRLSLEYGRKKLGL
ncbi:MAG: sugar phosphate isomerase/epimerase [Gemmataceae bacterium]|nr:sugar phosphate isomerase/epimerase [Gemmataceae bacterium]